MYLPWTITDARFLRSRGIPAYGFSPFVAAVDLSPAVPALSPRGGLVLGAVLALVGAARIRSASRRRRGALA